MLAGDVHHHEFGRVAELRPIGLGPKLLGVADDRRQMRLEAIGALVVVDLVAGVEIGIKRAFGVDDQLAPAR